MEYKLSSFKFDDILSRDQKHMAIMRINALRSACPSDASFSGGFKFDGKKSYQGTLKVLFSKGEFGATVVAEDMDDLMEKLSAKIKSQIERWRETRFDQEDTFVDFGEKAKKDSARNS